MKPNVLLLFADQHNAGILGCEDHPDVLTPHLDRLAAEGTRFRRAYCQDGVCVPSRCSLFSGLYPRTLGCLANTDRSYVMAEVHSLASAFRDNGYATAAFGKRHLELACDHGWTETASHLAPESPGDNYVRWVHAQGLGKAFDQDWAAEWAAAPEGSPAQGQPMANTPMSFRVSDLPASATMEAWTGRRTEEFLRARRGADAPFFCFASFYRPHQPYTPLRGYFERFDRSHWGAGRRQSDGLFQPPSLRESPDHLPPLIQEQFSKDGMFFHFGPARRDEQHYRNFLAAYYALVEEIDTQIGGILRVLEETGQAENTLVIYASDHGDFAGAHGLIEKIASGHNIYEDILRVPLLVRWPGRIMAGATRDDLVELVDLYPTLAELCGLRLPPLHHPLQGRSLAATLVSGHPVGRRFCVSENWSQSTVITTRHKLGVWQAPRHPAKRDFRAFGDMLFDRESDPWEMHNRAGAEDYRDVEKELRGMLREWENGLAERTPPCDPSLSACPRP